MIKDSYSIPPYDQFNWSEVDWETPLPNDLVALAEKVQEVRYNYYQTMQRIVAAGGTGRDIPSLSMWTWDHAVVPTGFFSGAFDADKYDVFGKMVFCGDYVREDRMLAAMSDEEMLEYFDRQDHIRSVIDQIDIDATIAEVDARKKAKHAEIEMLNAMLRDE